MTRASALLNLRAHLPLGIDADALLDAIETVESSRGANNWPRVEAAYVPAGVSITVQGRIITGTCPHSRALVMDRWKQWGIASAASWGPWQILFHTAADLGYLGAPHRLHDPEDCAPWVVARLLKIVGKGAGTVEEIADAWNSGTHLDSITVPEYRAKVKAAYDRERSKRIA